MKYTDIVRKVYEYEMNCNLPETERLLVFNDILGIPIEKEGVSSSDIRSRYEKILEPEEEAVPRDEEVLELDEEESTRDEEIREEESVNTQDSFIVQRIRKMSITDSKLLIIKELKKGREDRSVYSVKNLSNGINAYLSLDTDKKIGFTVDGTDVILCGRKIDQENTELYDFEEEGMEFFCNYYKNTLWPYLIEREEEIKREKQLAEEARLREENIRISPLNAKRIKKVTKIKKIHVVENEELKGFDFRKIPLENLIFINCDLTAANFTDCNLASTVFYDCILEGIEMTGCNIDQATIIKSPRDEE